MRRSSKIVIGLAGLLVVLAAVTRFVVLPMGSKLPDDTKVSARYTGTATLLNAEALQSGNTAHVILKNVPINIERRIKVTSTHGDTAVVADDFTLRGPNGLKTVDNHVYALDRVSLEGVAAPSGTKAEPADGGLTIAWPLSPDAHGHYRAYDSATRTVVPVKDKGSRSFHGRDSFDYAYTAVGAVRDPALTTALPPALPKALAAKLAPLLPATVRGKLAPALATLPDPIPLGYTATTQVSATVDADTGLPLDESIDQQIVAYVDVNGEKVDLMPVLATKAALTPQSIDDAVGKAGHAALLLTLIGVVAPIVLLLVAVVLFAAGWHRRHRPSTARVEGVSIPASVR
jgi:hypothetical protein